MSRQTDCTNRGPRTRRISALLVASAAALVLVIGSVTRTVRGDDAKMKDSPAMQLATLGLKFNGANSCKGSGCHNKAGDKAPPAEGLHELTIWKAKDLHAKSFEDLSNKDSKEITGKLKIADAAKSDKCLSCHALNVAANLRGASYNIKEGNTCESCHGPSEKWLKDHADPKWQNEQRAKMDHATLVKTTGLYDTRPLIVRAELCASCHLSIDHELVAAGHPETKFDLAYLSDLEPKHWSETHFKGPEGYKETAIWAAGQAVGLREAMQQLSDRAKAKAPADAIADAWQQALAHANVFQPAASTIGLDGAGIKTHMDALDKMKPEDGDKLAAEADAIVAICAKVDAKKVDDWQADAATTKAWLDAVSKLTGMGKKYGQFGMDQQAMSITSLYTASWNGVNKKKPDDSIENDATFKKLTDALFPEKTPSGDDWDKVVAGATQGLPK
jgi:cytochrome c554/c'-like protein